MTSAFFSYLRARREELKEQWACGGFVRGTQEETEWAQGINLATCRTIQDMIDLDFITVNQGNRDE